MRGINLFFPISRRRCALQVYHGKPCSWDERAGLGSPPFHPVRPFPALRLDDHRPLPGGSERLQFPLAALQWSLMDEYTTLISLLLVVVVLVILIASRI